MIHVIHDPRQTEKLELLSSHLNERGVPFTVHTGIIDRKTVEESINASHKMLVKWAKEEQMDEICIGEDDLFFPAKDGWNWYLSNKPQEFDIYLGGCYGVPMPIINPLKEFVALHLYTIRSSWYDSFLSAADNTHIDTAQTGGRFFCCYPMAAVQRAGYSANNHRECDYNTSLRKEDIYGGLTTNQI
ncbi:MAG TPA: hypothetical protein VGZ90_13460 [Puia sp.]|jgi:hypothetical protein|nr:hypothetical protein [Puia sp.]